ncbi:MAG TPA: hypothetical protein VJ924_04350 [Alphaproteobacteria bacterium]|nr:hypothetical protein [Alphaproteobacteria bacterium]
MLKFAYGESFDAESRFDCLRAAAEALNADDLPRAVLATVAMRLPALPGEMTAERLAKAHHILAHNYDADQPRDAHGRWICRMATASIRPWPLRACSRGFTLNYRAAL